MIVIQKNRMTTDNNMMSSARYLKYQNLWQVKMIPYKKKCWWARAWRCKPMERWNKQETLSGKKLWQTYYWHNKHVIKKVIFLSNFTNVLTIQHQELIHSWQQPEKLWSVLIWNTTWLNLWEKELILHDLIRTYSRIQYGSVQIQKDITNFPIKDTFSWIFSEKIKYNLTP